MKKKLNFNFYVPIGTGRYESIQTGTGRYRPIQNPKRNKSVPISLSYRNGAYRSVRPVSTCTSWYKPVRTDISRYELVQNPKRYKNILISLNYQNKMYHRLSDIGTELKIMRERHCSSIPDD